MENTMIQIKKETANKLKDLTRYKRETYDEIINRMIIELEEDMREDDLTLNEETIKEIKEGEGQIKRGEFYTTKQLKKELGIE